MDMMILVIDINNIDVLYKKYFKVLNVQKADWFKKKKNHKELYDFQYKQLQIQYKVLPGPSSAWTFWFVQSDPRQRDVCSRYYFIFKKHTSFQFKAKLSKLLSIHNSSGTSLIAGQLMRGLPGI